MRSVHMPRGVLVALCLAIFASACSRGAHWQTVSLAGGGTIGWKPAAPCIGDLVTVSGRLPGGSLEGGIAGIQDSLRGPDGSSIAPIVTDPVRGGAEVRWSFRVTRAGSWTLDRAEGKRQMLWTTATVAGEETELKKLDTQYLWKGKKP